MRERRIVESWEIKAALGEFEGVERQQESRTWRFVSGCWVLRVVWTHIIGNDRINHDTRAV